MTDVVVGVGNPVMTDDGIGKAVIDALHDEGVVDGEDVRATHAGTTAFLALEAMSGADRAIVIDAVDVDSPPGSIHQFEYEDGEFPDLPDVLMHDFSFTEALSVGTEAYDLPDEIVLIGVVPAKLETGVGLSDRLEARVPDVVATVETELGIRDETDIHTGAATMESNWYCTDCEEHIEAEAVEEHEAKGHEVQGQLRPDRLLEQDPWEIDGDSPEQSD
jgi:hydrogenase maturation protease